MENTITFNQLDNFEMFENCIIEVSIDKLNQNSEILDSILEYMYFDLEMSELEKYITKDGSFEIDFTMFQTICMTYKLNVKVSSSYFNFEFNPPSKTPILKHWKFPFDSEKNHFDNSEEVIQFLDKEIQKSNDDEDELIPMTKKECEDWDNLMFIPCYLKDKEYIWKKGEKVEMVDLLVTTIKNLHNEWCDLKYPSQMK
jgi:hypothetical protein